MTKEMILEEKHQGRTLNWVSTTHPTCRTGCKGIGTVKSQLRCGQLCLFFLETSVCQIQIAFSLLVVNSLPSRVGLITLQDSGKHIGIWHIDFAREGLDSSGDIRLRIMFTW